MTDDLASQFGALLGAGDHLPLDRAVLMVAAHAVPGLDVEAQLARLDEIAAGVREPTVAGLRKRLVDELGFSGDRQHYHDPANSLLPSVLDRRMGIPLSLAIVAIEVGRRCGVELVGVGMPGHFLVREPDSPETFLDMYDGGVELDADGCRAIFERLNTGASWDARFLAPVGNVAIVSRLLANLASAFRHSGDRASLAWAIDLRLLLPGPSERDRREMALLLGAVGRYDAAAKALEATGTKRDQRAAARLRARLN